MRVPLVCRLKGHLDIGGVPVPISEMSKHVQTHLLMRNALEGLKIGRPEARSKSLVREPWKPIVLQQEPAATRNKRCWVPFSEDVSCFSLELHPGKIANHGNQIDKSSSENTKTWQSLRHVQKQVLDIENFILAAMVFTLTGCIAETRPFTLHFCVNCLS